MAEKIPNLDSTDNPACTNPADGSATSGAGGFWVKDGENSPGGDPTDTAQGNCMTCHDVHWALASTDKASPAFNPEARAVPERVHHLPREPRNVGVGRAADRPGDDQPPEDRGHATRELGDRSRLSVRDLPHAEIGGESSNTSPMHLWRINTDPNYHTMGATEANTAPDVGEGYTNAAWVDIEHACGQCHGTDGIDARMCLEGTCAPPRSTEVLATVAKGMHSAAAVSYFVNFNIGPVSGLQVPVTATVDCGGVTCPSFTYDWDWGDGTQALGATASETHTYASGGSESITLTVLLNGSSVGSATRSVRLFNPDLPRPLWATASTVRTGGR